MSIFRINITVLYMAGDIRMSMWMGFICGVIVVALRMWLFQLR